MFYFVYLFYINNLDEIRWGKQWTKNILGA